MIHHALHATAARAPAVLLCALTIACGPGSPLTDGGPELDASTSPDAGDQPPLVAPDAALADAAPTVDAGLVIDCDGAAPVPVRVEGALVHGGPIVVGGGCLGEVTEPVLLWDDAEAAYPDASDGDVVPVGDEWPWIGNREDRMQFASSPTHDTRGTSTAHFAGSGARGHHNYLQSRDYAPGPDGYDTVYLSWWVRIDTVTSEISSKLVRLWAGELNGRTYRMSWTTMHLTYAYEEDLGTDADPWASTTHDLIPPSWATWQGEQDLASWHRQELLFISSSSPDADDGRVLCTTDGVVEHDLRIATWLAAREPRPDEVRRHTRGGFDPPNRLGVLGLDPSLGDRIGDYAIDVDDVYFAASPARVEICDTPRWSERPGAHCELQPRGERWEPTQIAVTAHQGGLAADADAWLFVVRGDLAVNEEGLPVRFSSAP